MGKRGVRFLEDERGFILPGILYADDLEDLKEIVYTP